MNIHKNMILAAVLFGLALPVFAAPSLYPMNGGNNRRENRSLAPSSITNPLQVKWTTPACDIIHTPAGGPVVLTDRVIQAFQHGVRCVDRATGTPLWTWPTTEVELYYTPTYDPDRDRLYLCRMDGSTVCLSPQTGNVLWYFYENATAGVGQFCSPVYAENKIFVGNGGNGMACLDPDTQAVCWRFNFSTYFGTSFRDGVCTPAYDNGFIYFSTRTGHLFCLRASDGAVVWHVYEQCWRQNALLLSDDYVYSMANQGQLTCRSRIDGSLVWSTTMTGTTDGNLALCGTMLIVPGDSWRIWGINMYTGAKVWCTKLTGNFARSSPFVSCGKVYISACHGDYYGLDGQTGAIEWRYYHGVEYTFVDWAEADGNLFVALKDGRIFCFEPQTPGNPLACVCNLDGNFTPSPTFTRTPTFTPTPTYTPAPAVTPGCSGSLCLTSDPSRNMCYFPSNNMAPLADGNGNDWTDADYQLVPGPIGWIPAQAVTQPPGEWVAPCGLYNQDWIAPLSSGLPPNLSDTYFRNSFTLPAGVTVTGVSLTLSGDNEVEVWLNGNYVGLVNGPFYGDSHLYTRCATVPVNPNLFLPGNNVFAFRLLNSMTYLGLTYEACLTYTCPEGTSPNTPTPLPTNTPTFTPTITTTFTPSFTPTITDTFTPTSTSSLTPTFTATSTPTRGMDCTFTQGYWKTHNRYATQPGQMLPWPISEDTLLCGMTWYNILWNQPNGNAWTILAHQWIAAKLNITKGASAPADVQAAIIQGEALLTGNCATMPASQSPSATSLATLLDNYNKGLVGPGHCAGDIVTDKPVLYPNPITGDDVEYLHLPKITEPTDVTVKIYTVSYRKIAEKNCGTVQPGVEPILNVTDKVGDSLANGLYYVETEMKTRGISKKYVQKLLVIK